MDQGRLLLRGRLVLPGAITPEPHYLEMAGGWITYIGRDRPAAGVGHVFYDLGAGLICPGFIDLHVHGAGGSDVMDGTPESLGVIAGRLAAGGTASFLGATMSAGPAVLERVLSCAADYLRGPAAGSRLLGIHLEGPFLNPAQKGAQSAAALRLPNVQEFKSYLAAGCGIVKMMTIAPELPGAEELLEYAKSQGLIISLGHSRASYEQVINLCDKGLTHATHVFNAMTGLHHRQPGTVGAVLTEDRLTADLIADGHHVHPAVIRLLVRAKGIGRVCVITDCTRAGGMGDGTYELGGQLVRVKERRAFLAGGTIAGSTICMADAVNVLIKDAGFSLPEAVQMASTNPAKVLRMENLGVLAPGKIADVTVLDEELKVCLTVVSGRVVYRRVGLTAQIDS